MNKNKVHRNVWWRWWPTVGRSNGPKPQDFSHHLIIDNKNENSFRLEFVLKIRKCLTCAASTIISYLFNGQKHHYTIRAHFVESFSFFFFSLNLRSSIAMSQRFFIQPLWFVQCVFISNRRSSFNISFDCFLLLVTSETILEILEFKFTSFNTTLFCSAVSQWEIQWNLERWWIWMYDCL